MHLSPKISAVTWATLAIVVLLALLAWPALDWLVRSWAVDPYYTHGFLIPPLAALLAWRQWRQVKTEPRRSEPWSGSLLTAASLAVIIWAMRWQDYVIASLALVVLIAGILLYLEGWPRLRHWLFPLLFLLLMVPLPLVDRLSPWFQSFTARWATALVRLVGIPAAHYGGEIVLPTTTLVVGAPCSGLRSLVAMLTVMVVWVYVIEGRPAAKALLLAAAVPLVAFSNVLRIALLLVVATLWGEQVALAYYHDWSGLLLYLGALGLLLLLGRVLGCYRLRKDIF